MFRFWFRVSLVIGTAFSVKAGAQAEVATYCVRGTINSPVQGQWPLVDGSNIVEVAQGSAVYSFQLQFYAQPPPSNRVGRAEFSAILTNGSDFLTLKDSEGRVSVRAILREKLKRSLKGERFRCDCADRFYTPEENLSFRFMFGHLFSMNFFGYTWNSPEALQEYPNYHGQTLAETGDLYSVAAQVNPGQCLSEDFSKL